MDIPSLMSLLTESSLTFVRADLMEDSSEGTFPTITAAQIDSIAQEMIKQGTLRRGPINLSQELESFKKEAYINCWCKENYPMVHMWKIYSKENGVAIETTYTELKDSVTDNETAYPSEIQYLDFERESMNWIWNTLQMLTVKKIAYKSENEFRLIMTHPRQVEDQLLKFQTHEEKANRRASLYRNTEVIKLKIDLRKLITNVHISPFSPRWHTSLVKNILEHFELSTAKVIRSEL